MSDKYLRRTTILFKRGEKFDEELLEMLEEVTPSSNFSPKIKELAYEYLKMTQPKIYNSVVNKVNTSENSENKAEKGAKQPKTAQKSDSDDNKLFESLLKIH